MKKMSHSLHCFLLLFFVAGLTSTSYSQAIKVYEGAFPVPPANKAMLFYLQRTMNVNTVVYEINYQTDGEVNKKQPVKIYWINYAEDGKTSPLTFMQNKFAYGIESTLLETEKPTFKINLVSYKKVDIYLRPVGKDGSYQAQVSINGKQSSLVNIRINIVGGTYLRPIVYDIVLTGKDLETGEKVTEKIKP